MNLSDERQHRQQQVRNEIERELGQGFLYPPPTGCSVIPSLSPSSESCSAS
jgi:hypothetical protein